MKLLSPEHVAATVRAAMRENDPGLVLASLGTSLFLAYPVRYADIMLATAKQISTGSPHGPERYRAYGEALIALIDVLEREEE